MANSYYVAPLGGMDVGAKLSEVIKGGKQQQRMMEWQDTAPDIIKSGDPDAISELMVKYPEMIDTIGNAAGYKQKQAQADLLQTAKSILINGEEPAQALGAHIQKAQGAGEDVTRPMTTLGKSISNPQHGIEWAKKFVALNAPTEYTAWSKSQPTAIGETEINVKSSEILEDGTIIQSTTGGPVVYSPEGERLKGRAAAQAIKIGRAEKVSNIRKGAGEKKTATLEAELDLKGKVAAGVIGAEEAAKISVKAFDRLEKINTNIRNIDEAISLLDQGAQTGVVEKMLPSVRAASVKLDNLQGRLGLDVIGQTTFGALSESELKFALDTALPQGLQPEELKKWLTDKKKAQEKLSDYLEASAIYLGTPGNTVTGWIKSQKNKQSVLPPGVTEDDITTTMQVHGMTREEVLAKLKGGQ